MNNLEKAVVGVISIGVLLSSYLIYHTVKQDIQNTRETRVNLEVSSGEVMQSFDRLDNTFDRLDNTLDKIETSLNNINIGIAYLNGLIDGSSSVRGYNQEQTPNNH